jgi:nucleoside-diphosphate-sugar epimerase
MAVILVFGGAGFVGTHLVKHLRTEARSTEIIVVDKDISGVSSEPQSILADIRKPIDINIPNEHVDAIINLAAVHKSPGHPSHEYFEANILGARNVCAFAEKHDIKQIIFTSSISVYGPDENEKTEESLTCPNIPYGISKIIAEYIHREWYLGGPGRHLTIVRPAVIFGKGEKGNFTRIAKALRKGIFVYPGRRNTIKSCCYVKDICGLIFREIEQARGYSLYNFCYPQKITLEGVCNTFHEALGYNLPIASVPQIFVNMGVSVVKKVDLPFFRSLGLHPERVAKLVNSTNISSKKLMDSGFSFKYDLFSALKDWSNDCGSDVLY